MLPFFGSLRRIGVRACFSAATLLCLVLPGGVYSQNLSPFSVDSFKGKPRVVVLSDIGNEPDDQMSLVRLLVYSNEMDIEGLVAGTSTWLRTHPNTQTMRDIIGAYAKARPNLTLHASGWPEAEQLNKVITEGQPRYGMAAVGAGQMSEGAELIIRAADRPDPRPLWISIWGGANTLAQALQHVRETRSPESVDVFVAKLRIYSISDQDDAGPWIRREFPNLFYIVQPSTQDSADYASASWTGISGDLFYQNSDGADGDYVTNEWLDAHVRSKGALGRHYPRFAYIMEGDTPAFLGLIQNGLNSYRNPSWGGWGGRYVFRKPYGEAHSIWTQGGDIGSGTSSRDKVIGIDGKPHVSDQATIWRWRSAFQNDFAARMDWTIKPFAEANHNPVAIVNGESGADPIVIEAEVGKPVSLDASGSNDPDGDKLQFTWISYPEAGYVPGQKMADIRMSSTHKPRTIVTPVATCRSGWLPSPNKCKSGIAHLILQVTDNGKPVLSTYRRIIFNIHQP